MAKLIADISSHNETFDAKKMKNIGIKGVIIRAGYRKHDTGKVCSDPKYKKFIEAAVLAKLPVSAYWWTQAMSDEDAIEEANVFIKLISGIKISMPLFLDLEFYNSKKQGRADKLSATRRTKYAITFIKRCRELGYQCGVYCNPDFWKNNLIPSKLNTYPRWIAHYAKSATMDCDMWQFTSTAKGTTYGVGSKYIDLSNMYTDFLSGEKSKFDEYNTYEEKVVNNKGENAPSKNQKFVGYVSAQALNVRTGPGVSYPTVSFSPISNKEEVSVCDAVKADNGDIWYYIKYKGKFGFCSSKYIDKTKPKEESKSADSDKVDYLKESVYWMKTIYDKIVSIGCQHKSGALTYEDIVKKRRTTCTSTITAVFVKVGLLKKGKRINHKKAVGGSPENILKKKNSIEKSMTGYENLDLSKCDVVYVGAKDWNSMPERYKKAGYAYIQDSNGFMCGGKNSNGLWVNRSCNNSGSQVRKDKNGVKRYYNNKNTSGYTFKSPILVVIMPKS